jgi:hypothetical protein
VTLVAWPVGAVFAGLADILVARPAIVRSEWVIGHQAGATRSILMEMTPPRAMGKRLAWTDLPEEVRVRIEAEVGTVVASESMTGGFSPGLAARLTLASGEVVFAKAVSGAQNEVAPQFHRREIVVAELLPRTAPVPRLLWSWADDDPAGWVVLVYENVVGHPPAQPWEPAEFERVVDALNALSRDLTPSPVSAEALGARTTGLPIAGGYWRRLRHEGLVHPDPWVTENLDALIALEDRVPDIQPGSTLLHMDLRGDNMLIAAEGVVIVDWPHAAVGPAWLDGVAFAPSVAMEGGPEPQALVELLDAMRAADPTELTIGIAEIAGYFTYHALLPEVPSLPGLREFQEAQGVVARRWLAGRPGWMEIG